MLAFYRNSLADLLAVRNDRVGQRNLYAKLILQLGAQNVQMNIAGTGDQVLLGFRVELGIEGRILIMQTSKTGGDLLLNALYFIIFWRTRSGCSALSVSACASAIMM